MKVKTGFKLNQVCGQHFLMPMGEKNIDFSKMIVLNESSLLLWKRMEQNDFSEDDLAKVLLDEYEIDEDTVRKDVANFLSQLRAESVIVED